MSWTSWPCICTPRAPSFVSTRSAQRETCASCRCGGRRRVGTARETLVPLGVVPPLPRSPPEKMVMDKRLARAFEQVWDGCVTAARHYHASVPDSLQDPYLMSPEFPDVIRRRIVTNTRAARAFRRNLEQRAGTYAPDPLHSGAQANEASMEGAVTQAGAASSQLELRSVPVSSPDDWGERWLRVHPGPPAGATASSAILPIAVGRPYLPPRRTSKGALCREPRQEPAQGGAPYPNASPSADAMSGHGTPANPSRHTMLAPEPGCPLQVASDRHEIASPKEPSGMSQPCDT